MATMGILWVLASQHQAHPGVLILQSSTALGLLNSTTFAELLQMWVGLRLTSIAQVLCCVSGQASVFCFSSGA